ncbi:hypothetical protein EV702DRAFT_1049973 [Suillus placidus]|uniref:Uncharacterized protein n=1 Tax=Suillus placidus TaxID=48579 RepID=A0A9P6ZK12_9AGAM|nr:hypothetical protein EV702DRAFT_1049973 [Suillus placidus]
MNLEARNSEPPEISSSNTKSPDPPSSSLLLPLLPSPKPQTNNPEKKNNEPHDALPTPSIAPANMTPTTAPMILIDTCVTSTISKSVNVDLQSKPGPTSKNFCPATTKNGSNLSAHRWLKQVAPNGYSRDFKSYWDSLGKDCQECSPS